MIELSAEYLNQIKQGLEKQKQHQRLRQAANLLNQTRKKDLVEIINATLNEEHCPLITEAQIQFYPQYIGNAGIGMPIDKGLTKIIYDYYYPPASLGQYAHFTDLFALESILTNQKIRLTSTIKRKDEAEFELFYEHHDEIDGYSRDFGTSIYSEDLMKDLFYISLTDNQDSVIDIKRGMWRYFGKNGEGVKLIFEISTEHGDFRRVYYPNSNSSKNKQLVKKLTERISSEFSMPLLFNSISKFGAFYIDAGYEDESEARFLIKKFSDDYPFPFTIHHKDNIPYIELNFESPWGIFKPIQVQPGLKCSRDEVQQIVDQSGLNIEVLSNATSI